MKTLLSVILLSAFISACASKETRTPSSEEPSIQVKYGKQSTGYTVKIYSYDNPGTDFALFGFKDPVSGMAPICYSGSFPQILDFLEYMEKYQNKMAKLSEAVPEEDVEYIKIMNVDIKTDRITVTYKANSTKRKVPRAAQEVFEMTPCSH